ncbi:MAG: SbcC/MukB-like Walker B domain-containing protein, partial [Chitinophagales bacterium]
LTGSITTGKSNLETLTRLLKETADNLFDLEKNSGIDILTATTLLASQLNVPASRNSLQQFQLKLHTATQLLEESEKNTAGKTYDATLHDQLLQELTACSSLIEQQQQQSATLSASINQAKQQVEQRILLTQELNTVQLRGEDISTLKNLFKASGFVNYVSSVHLQQLCNAANDRFYKLTRQKLRLEVSESNNFLVRDFMNNGQLRSVKTLSGGQKFQAALSLALALADSIQIHSQSKQNFFFLDEGFGSLDSDSLDMVFETLRSLRKENRIVGIISHVKEMQQEIDTCLTIVNDEEKGSEIVANW